MGQSSIKYRIRSKREIFWLELTHVEAGASVILPLNDRAPIKVGLAAGLAKLFAELYSMGATGRYNFTIHDINIMHPNMTDEIYSAIMSEEENGERFLNNKDDGLWIHTTVRTKDGGSPSGQEGDGITG